MSSDRQLKRALRPFHFFQENGKNGLDLRNNRCKHIDMSTYDAQELERFAEIFKALASPHRLAIFLRLVELCPPGKTCAYDEEIRECVGDMGKDLGIARTTVSHHVKELRRAGLLKVEKHGRKIECHLGDETVRDLIDLLSGDLKLEIHSTGGQLQAGSRK